MFQRHKALLKFGDKKILTIIRSYFTMSDEKVKNYYGTSKFKFILRYQFFQLQL